MSSMFLSPCIYARLRRAMQVATTGICSGVAALSSVACIFMPLLSLMHVACIRTHARLRRASVHVFLVRAPFLHVHGCCCCRRWLLLALLCCGAVLVVWLVPLLLSPLCCAAGCARPVECYFTPGGSFKTNSARTPGGSRPPVRAHRRAPDATP